MWIFFALLSAFFAALVSIAGKLALKNFDPIFMTTIRSIAMAVIMVVIAFVTNKLTTDFSKITKHDLIFLALAAFSGALSWTFYFIALKTGPVKGVYALDKLSVIILIIMAWLSLSEKLTIKAILGGILMFVGVLLLQ